LEEASAHCKASINTDQHNKKDVDIHAFNEIRTSDIGVQDAHDRAVTVINHNQFSTS
jgi:hypothetical protein